MVEFSRTMINLNGYGIDVSLVWYRRNVLKIGSDQSVRLVEPSIDHKTDSVQ